MKRESCLNIHVSVTQFPPFFLLLWFEKVERKFGSINIKNCQLDCVPQLMIILFYRIAYLVIVVTLSEIGDERGASTREDCTYKE